MDPADLGVRAWPCLLCDPLRRAEGQGHTIDNQKGVPQVSRKGKYAWLHCGRRLTISRRTLDEVHGERINMLILMRDDSHHIFPPRKYYPYRCSMKPMRTEPWAPIQRRDSQFTNMSTRPHSRRRGSTYLHATYNRNEIFRATNTFFI